MGKKLSGLTDGLISLAKAAPLIAGATAGLVFPAKNCSDGVIKKAMKGEFSGTGGALDQLLVNYTFYSPIEHEFQSFQGLGVKALTAGVIVHKLIGWIADA